MDVPPPNRRGRRAFSAPICHSYTTTHLNSLSARLEAAKQCIAQQHGSLQHLAEENRDLRSQVEASREQIEARRTNETRLADRVRLEVAKLEY